MEIVCDFCGCSGVSDSWGISVYNRNYHLENVAHEIRKDACGDCAKKISDIIKRVKPNP